MRGSTSLIGDAAVTNVTPGRRWLVLNMSLFKYDSLSSKHQFLDRQVSAFAV